MATEKSVVYVLDGYSLSLDERGLVAAQRYALGKSLPLAVVSIVPGEELSQPPIDQLSAIENQLEPLKVPLLALVGERGQALTGLSRHVSPRIFPQDSISGGSTLRTHPVKWPSRIQSVKELFKYASDHPEMCLF